MIDFIRRSLQVTCAVAALASAGVGLTRTPPAQIVEQAKLQISPPLSDEKEATNLSGAACEPNGVCMLIGDEKRYARIFRLRGNVLAPDRAQIFLLPKLDRNGKKTKESDGEGVAFADGYFYVVGSHSNSKSGEQQPSRHHLWRIAVDPQTGLPRSFGSDDAPAAGLGDVALDYFIAAHPRLKAHLTEAAGELKPGEEGNFDKDQHGPNIEGVAVLGDRIFIGFRGPVDADGALLVELPVKSLFEKKKPAPVSYPPLRLGEAGMGVRDLAAVSNGLVILSGPEMRARFAEPSGSGTNTACIRACPKASLHFWSPAKPDQVTPLGDLDLTGYGGDSPEAIALLEETTTHYRFLILSDGDGKSAPRVISVARRP